MKELDKTNIQGMHAMNRQLLLIRIIFLLVCTLLFTTYMTGFSPEGATFASMTIGIVAGLLFGIVLIGTESLLKDVSLRSFNVATLGLFCGYLMGSVILHFFDAIIEVSGLFIPGEYYSLLSVTFFLFCGYLGMAFAVRSAEELHLSIPFIRLESTTKKKKDIVLDSSTLLDTRVIDLATSGLLDNHLIVPRFILKELHLMHESGDEASKIKARRCLEAIRKLESIPGLNLRYVETDFSDLKDTASKLARLARIMDATIMTADLNKTQSAVADGTRTVNIHTLSNALKAIPQNGEFLTIKIQRYGKDPRQGVGYLEDGTMVVVNGGAEFLGHTIKAQIVSVKSTLSGRMIFCNAMEESLSAETEQTDMAEETENSQSSYYSV